MTRYNEALLHLELLGGSDRHVFLVKPEARGDKDPRPSKILCGTFPEVADRLTEFQDDGYAVFVQVQEGASATKRDIQRARAFFFDFDDGELPTLPKPPTLILKTPRGWHVYYAIAPTRYLKEWHSIQEAMQRDLGGDPSCNMLNQKARLAGFDHQKKGGRERIRIVEQNDTFYTLEDFEDYLEAFAEAEPVEEALICEYAPLPRKWEYPLLRYWLRSLLRKLREATEGNRFLTLKSVAFQMGIYAAVGLDARLAITNMRRIVRTWSNYDHADGFRTIERCFKIGYQRGLVDPPHAPPEQRLLFARQEKRQAYLESISDMLPGLASERGRISVESVLRARPDWPEAFSSDRSARVAIGGRLRSLGLVEKRRKSGRFFERVPD